MGISTKKVSIVIIVSVITLIIAWFVVKSIAARKLDSFIDNLPNHIQLSYEDDDMSLLSGNLILHKPILTIKGKTTDKVNAKLKLKSFSIEGFSYYNYMMNEDISLDRIEFNQAKIFFLHDPASNKTDYVSSLKDDFKSAINVSQLDIVNSSVELVSSESDSLLLNMDSLSLYVSNLSTNFKKSSMLPLDYEDLNISVRNIAYQLNDYEILKADQLNFINNQAKVSNLELKTVHSKEHLSEVIDKERDHFDLKIPLLEMNNVEIGSDNGGLNGFRSSTIILDAPKFNIYRDKRVADDFTIKPLYSQMLRELKVDLELKQISINDGLIVYEEKVRTDARAGQLQFSKLNATIDNVSNDPENTRMTSIDVKCNFMKEAPLHVEWQFDVKNIDDQFTFKADIGTLQAQELNQFMQPNLNIKFESELIQTYFSIYGNSYNSKIDLKTKYDQFDLIILQEDGKEKNKFLSGIVNLFISKESTDESDGYRYSDTEAVERDRTKSIFNFVWKSTRAGLRSAMVGDGKKDD